MELKDQVCPLEEAKRLKKLGIHQESLWWWKELTYADGFKAKTVIVSSEYKGDSVDWIGDISTIKYYSAFTIAELGELLPQFIKNRDFMLTTVKNEDWGWWCGYMNHKGDITITASQGDTEANARALMLIDLKEKG